MRRARFKRVGNVLVDRTHDGHATFIHSVAVPADATNEAVRRIEAGDYRVAALLSVADLGRVRAALLAGARAASNLEPNLSHALALLGGVEERRILWAHLRESLRSGFPGKSEEEQFRILYNAEALLSLRPSILATRLLMDAVQVRSPGTTQIAAKVVSDYLLTNPPLRIQRLLLARLPSLLVADDESFASAVPILLRRHFSKTEERCRRLFVTGADTTRRRLIGNLVNCPYYGLPLLLRAFDVEPRLDLRLSIAAAVAPALRAKDVSKLVAEALADESPAIRLSGARLLSHLESRTAERLSRRKDPEPKVDKELQSYRRQKAAKRHPSPRTRPVLG
jgi:hypothetical protein